MSEHTKTFDYQVDGLSYTVTVYEQDGGFFADISVIEGAMDVNAVYFGDDDFSGASKGLKGPLNMNGAGSRYEEETVQWDDAVELSRPGLGRAGEDKETFLSEGDTLTLGLSIDSLDDIDFFGIRATSTTTDEGSIKAVSGEPEVHDDPEEPEEPDDPADPTYDKVFFAQELDEDGEPIDGFSIQSEEPEDNPFNVPFLPEGTEPTFENYLAYFEEIGGQVNEVETAIFYQQDEDGEPQEEFRIDAPEGGFTDADELLEAYDSALEAFEDDSDAGGEANSANLMAALSLEVPPEDEIVEEAQEDIVDLEAA